MEKPPPPRRIRNHDERLRPGRIRAFRARGGQVTHMVMTSAPTRASGGVPVLVLSAETRRYSVTAHTERISARASGFTGARAASELPVPASRPGGFDCVLRTGYCTVLCCAMLYARHGPGSCGRGIGPYTVRVHGALIRHSLSRRSPPRSPHDSLGPLTHTAPDSFPRRKRPSGDSCAHRLGVRHA